MINSQTKSFTLIEHEYSKSRGRNEGFTLIELLVVIAIIGLISVIVLVSMQGAREDAKIAKTKQDLRTLLTGIMRLEGDTEKWPNGCPPFNTANPEVDLDNPQAGLNTRPTEGVVQNPCEWTAWEVSAWNGPYIAATSLADPWGNPYWFDPDYTCLTATAGCEGIPDSTTVVAIHSGGPNGSGVNQYDADNIVIVMSR